VWVFVMYGNKVNSFYIKNYIDNLITSYIDTSKKNGSVTVS